VLNGPSARAIPVPLSFLGRGEYHAMMIRDRQNDPASVQIENAKIRSRDSLILELNSGGGFIARFTRD